jgi:hypothetical protein
MNLNNIVENILHLRIISIDGPAALVTNYKVTVTWLPHVLECIRSSLKQLCGPSFSTKLNPTILFAFLDLDT